MTDSAQEKEYGVADPAAEAGNTNHSEPQDNDGSEKEYIEVNAHRHGSSQSGSDEEANDKEKRPVMDRSKSYATNTSEITRTESHVTTVAPPRPWYKKINPLRWSKAPPVPKERTVSREYTASFLSLVYFMWMSPLMSASTSTPSNYENANWK
jgi:ATP-binding cassette subfamily C (CFTR/MRP) protein 1